MTGRRSGSAPPVPVKRAAAYRAAPMRPPATVQLDGLAADLAALEPLDRVGSEHVRGAALVAAYAALRLAVTPVPVAGDRDRRREVIRAAVPALGRAGLSHVADLVAAALAHDADPASVVPGVERQQ